MTNQPYHEDIKVILQTKINQLNLIAFNQCKIELISFGSH